MVENHRFDARETTIGRQAVQVDCVSCPSALQTQLHFLASLRTTARSAGNCQKCEPAANGARYARSIPRYARGRDGAYNRALRLRRSHPVAIGSRGERRNRSSRKPYDSSVAVSANLPGERGSKIGISNSPQCGPCYRVQPRNLIPSA